MVRVIYVGPSPSVDLLDGTTCTRGTPVEVDDDLAVSLLEQDTWTAAKGASTTPEPTTPEPTTEPDPTSRPSRKKVGV